MILADKIITLRKKEGWSQEELASQLGVTRQSVSKWEGAQSVPDLDKVVQMSRLFGVSTDYLLKDELEEEEFVESEADETPLRRVTMEQAARYLALRKACAPKIALAVAMCIVSPVVIVFLSAMADAGLGGISEDLAAGLGVSVILVLVAIAVGMFLSCGAKTKEFDFLEKEPFETEYGVSGMVREREREFREKNSRLTVVGTVLCILSVLPMFAVISVMPAADDVVYIAAVCVLLFMVGLGCIAFVYSGTYHGAMEKLLEEGDYSRDNKGRRKVVGTISAVYWLIVTAVFLVMMFSPSSPMLPNETWIIWAVGGVLYAAVMAVVRLLTGRK
mgnify:CR=1 FL=1